MGIKKFQHYLVSILVSILITPHGFDNFDGWDGMIDHFIAMYQVLFDAVLYASCRNKTLLHDIGTKEGMANVGDKNEVKQLIKIYLKQS